MISPDTYAKRLDGASLQELIDERNGLIEFIRSFEENCIDFEAQKLLQDGDEWMICPGPDVRYQMYLEYLGKVCAVIRERFNREYE